MKGGQEHRIPLSGPTLDILREMAEARVSNEPDTLVFPGRDMGSPLSDMSLTAVLGRMGRHELTAHGFRSSFRDWAARANSIHSRRRDEPGKSTSNRRLVLDPAVLGPIGFLTSFAHRRRCS